MSVVISKIVNLLADANKQLVKLDTASQLISNTDLFISMYVRKEALISLQIEGTQCTLDDVLYPAVEANANLDVSDVAYEEYLGILRKDT